MSLKELLVDELNQTKTENGAKAFKSTKSDILNLFAIGGSARNIIPSHLYRMISQALADDTELAIRCILYLADIRAGQGERRLFKTALQVIADTQPVDVVKKVLEHVSFFGRWDYLLDFLTHRKYDTIILDIIKKEVDSKEVSLLYKWLPTLQLHTTKALIIAKHLGLTPKAYRKMLVKYRSELKVVEVDMSNNEWEKIDYSKLPSRASMIYRKAFERHDPERYQAYINSVIKGERKINASTIYPHELLTKIRTEGLNDTIEALWKNLPNFLGENSERNILPMVDVSGSMSMEIPNSQSTAMDVSVGLGMYLAERIKGEFKDHYLTFSAKPSLVKIKGGTLYQKMMNIRATDVGYSTNVIAAFNAILDTAVRNGLKQNDLPTHIVMFSDMEFDDATNDKTPFKHIQTSFESYGYKLPQVIFWNVNARNQQYPVTSNEIGVTLVSGFSPSALKYVLTGEYKTPYETMLDVLLQERYNIFK